MMQQHVAVVGDCAGCEEYTMIEETSVNDDGRRHVMLRCQDCDAEGELHHDGDLENGSWSGLLNPRLKSVNWIDCPRCDGYGEIEDPICDLRRAMNGREHSCPNCHGSGSVPRIVETDGGATPENGKEIGEIETYCKGCDQLSASHTKREDGHWECDDCGRVPECGNPQWSDNCNSDIRTRLELKKGMCEGCMGVIDSWSGDDQRSNEPTEQATLVADGGESIEEDLIEGHSPSDVETGEKILESPLTGNTYRVTKWVDQGDGQFIAIEKELIENE